MSYFAKCQIYLENNIYQQPRRAKYNLKNSFVVYETL